MPAERLVSIFLFEVLICISAFGQSAVRVTAVPQSVSSYWTLEPGWHSEIELGNNQSKEKLVVHPILVTSHGKSIRLDDIEVSPGEMRVFDLRNAIAALGENLISRANSFGTVIFNYNSQSEAGLYASLMIYRDGSPIAFHMPAYNDESMGLVKGAEAIWWLPNKDADGQVILTNTGTETMGVRVVSISHDGVQQIHSVEIGAKETWRSEVRALVGAGNDEEYGSLTFLPTTHSGKLQVAGLLFDELSGFAAMMRIFPITEGESEELGQLIAPMIALSHPDPSLGFPTGTELHSFLLLENVGSAPISSDIRLNWRAETGVAGLQLEQMALDPKKVQLIDISRLQLQKKLPSDIAWLSATVIFQGKPGQVIGFTGSYDSTGRYGMQSPFSYSIAPHWKGGRWRVDNQYNTILGTGNAGTEPVQASVVLYYDEGRSNYELPPQRLLPGEPLYINIGNLIQGQIPDKNGKRLPANATSGVFEFRADKRSARLYEGRLVIDSTYGHAVYGCAHCCDYDSSWLSDVELVAGGSEGATVLTARDCCTLDLVDATDEAIAWESVNPEVATISWARVTPVAPGRATIKASLPSHKCNPVPGGGCYGILLRPQGSATVKPALNSISPATGLAGRNVPVTLTGQGFSASNVSISAGTGITVVPGGVSDRELHPTFQIAANAPTGNHSVTVTASGQTSSSLNFAVDPSVTVSIRSGDSESVSSDNDAANTWALANGTLLLGAHYRPEAGVGVELVGVVIPSTFTSSIALRQQVLAYIGCTGNTQTDSGGVSPDDSEAPDNDPRPYGRVYALDAPGIDFRKSPGPTYPIGTVRRLRANFKVWAEFNGRKVSDDFLWFARVSAKKIDSDNNGEFVTDKVGDNRAGVGSTSLDCN